MGRHPEGVVLTMVFGCPSRQPLVPLGRNAGRGTRAATAALGRCSFAYPAASCCLLAAGASFSLPPARLSCAGSSTDKHHTA